MGPHSYQQEIGYLEQLKIDNLLFQGNTLYIDVDQNVFTSGVWTSRIKLRPVCPGYLNGIPWIKSSKGLTIVWKEYFYRVSVKLGSLRSLWTSYPIKDLRLQPKFPGSGEDRRVFSPIRTLVRLGLQAAPTCLISYRKALSDLPIKSHISLKTRKSGPLSLWLSW